MRKLICNDKCRFKEALLPEGHIITSIPQISMKVFKAQVSVILIIIRKNILSVGEIKRISTVQAKIWYKSSEKDYSINKLKLYTIISKLACQDSLLFF